MKEDLKAQTEQAFQQQFSTTPQLVCFSPGRINLLGEHIDYNAGFVLPAAIDKYVCVALAPTTGDSRIFAADINETFTFSTAHITKDAPAWALYILGVMDEMKKRGKSVPNVVAAFSSTIPPGSGLSSSAALECAFGYAFNELFELNFTKTELAQIGQMAEHHFVGVQCGIMDQFATIFGRENYVIKLDCLSLEHLYIPAKLGAYRLILLDSRVKHALHESEYNNRRRETAEGLSAMQTRFPEIRTFRDCTEEHLLAVRDNLSETIFRRCMYVIYEIQRVGEAVEALESGDMRRLGELMFETHDGLTHEYAVSCPEIDFLVNQARQRPEIIGARLMGGGFGGCTLNLIRSGTEDDVVFDISQAYLEEFEISPAIYFVQTADGTSHES